MAQTRRQNNASRPRYAQPAIVQTTAAVDARTACEQLEQLNRKLAAAHAEIRRYQTRLFAYERQMIALRRENAELEAACEQAREEALQAAAHAEMLAQQAAAETVPALQEQAPEAAAAECPPEEQPTAEPQAAEAEPAQQAAARPPAEPDWKPKTELDHLSVELMNWFDEMMGA